MITLSSSNGSRLVFQRTSSPPNWVLVYAYDRHGRCISFTFSPTVFMASLDTIQAFMSKDSTAGNAESTPLSAISEWARADRVADDRAADLQGIERAIALAGPPIPAELVTARERAAIVLREACQAEEKAEHAMREAARLLLAQEIEAV